MTGEPIPDPVLLLEIKAGAVIWPAPDDAAALGAARAKPLLEAALRTSVP